VSHPGLRGTAAAGRVQTDDRLDDVGVVGNLPRPLVRHTGVVAVEELVTAGFGLDPQVMRDRGTHPAAKPMPSRKRVVKLVIGATSVKK
jgi:hypothetical protein